MPHLKIATRESALALWQANFVKDELERMHPNLVVSLVGMTTLGDRWLDAPLTEVGGKGLFIKELEVAILDGRADLAVHSVKDLPAKLAPGFALPLMGFRADVRAALVGGYQNIKDLPQGARLGTSSARRRAQALALRPDLDVQPIRGNVNTRLAKLDAGEFDAIILAYAGLLRLGMERTDVFPMAVTDMLPAPGQGALGIETQQGSDVSALLEPFLDAKEFNCVLAERGVSAALGGDCSLPIAAHAVLSQQGDIRLEALVASPDGGSIIRSVVEGVEPFAVALKAVEALNEGGAQDILEAARRQR